ncbi:MAG: PQQ-like beta-propeller repeat protein [Williamsia sp.]|nr:PQQ-like beta-propeller repeat protein [Williamsia sp.]
MSSKVIILVIVFQTLLGCRPSRPAWWKYQGTTMNWGQSQAHRVMKQAVLRKSYQGPYCGCPVLWSDANHQSSNDSRIIMGIGSGGFASIVPFQLMIDHPTSFTGVLTSCPAVPYAGEASSSIYVATTDNRLLSLTYGLSVKWNTQFPDAFDASVGSPTVWDNLVFASSNDGFFYAVDSHNGTILWSHKIGGAPTFYSPPIRVGVDNNIYVANFEGDVFKFKASPTKTMVWQKHTTPEGVCISGHTMLDSRYSVYVPCTDGKIRILDPAAGNVSVFFDTHVPGNVTGTSYSFDGNLIYLADSQGNFYAVNTNTKQKAWGSKLPGPPTTPQVTANDETIYIGYGHGFADAGVVAFNMKQELWRVEGGMKGLVAYLACGEDGTVYAADGKELVAIR